MVNKRKTTKPLTKRSRCSNCQQRHIKCEYDGTDEKCMQCRKANRSCTIRHRFQLVNPLAPKRLKRQASNEADENVRIFPIRQEPTRVQISSSESSDTPEFLAQTNDFQADTSSPLSAPHPFATSIANSSPSSAIGVHAAPATGVGDGDICTSPASYLPSTFTATTPFHSPTAIPTPESLQLATKEKAILLRHFTDVISKWFDVCDAGYHFRRIVPLKALTSPTLLKAISASAAWHLNRLGSFDRERSNYLYQNCLDHLIRAMRGPAVGSDDSLLVAAVIMHHVEELRDLEHSVNLESRGHIIAMKVFLDNQNLTSECSSLRTAAFRSATREELHLSLVDQQPLTLPSTAVNVDRSWEEADDDTWAWRIILIFKDCLAFSLAPSSATDWDTLTQNVQSWIESRPTSFDPTFSQEACPEEGRQLPEKWFLHDCHTYGAIHYFMSNVVLAISNPRTPKFGWNKAAAMKLVEDEVRSSIIEICGIAMSNHLFPPGMTAATALITLFAEMITDHALQAALFEVLIRTRKIHAWPTEAAQSYLRSVWQVPAGLWQSPTQQ